MFGQVVAGRRNPTLLLDFLFHGSSVSPSELALGPDRKKNSFLAAADVNSERGERSKNATPKRKNKKYCDKNINKFNEGEFSVKPGGVKNWPPPPPRTKDRITGQGQGQQGKDQDGKINRKIKPKSRLRHWCEGNLIFPYISSGFNPSY